MNDILRTRISDALGRAENSASSPAEMLAALRELDAVARDHAAELPGDLHHYLTRRSYAKARMFLENLGPIPPGACGRGG